MYPRTEFFIHPLLVGWFSEAALVLTAASGVALFAFYTAISQGLPWRQGFRVHSIADQWTGWLALPWLTLATYLAWQVRGAFSPLKTEPLAQPEVA